MYPVKVNACNFTYMGPTPDVGDLPCQRAEGVVYSFWRPDPAELALLVAGGRVQLGISQEPIPPVSLTIRPNLGPWAAAVEDEIPRRAADELYDALVAHQPEILDALVLMRLGHLTAIDTRLHSREVPTITVQEITDAMKVARG